MQNFCSYTVSILHGLVVLFMVGVGGGCKTFLGIRKSAYQSVNSPVTLLALQVEVSKHQ